MTATATLEATAVAAPLEAASRGALKTEPPTVASVTTVVNCTLAAIHGTQVAANAQKTEPPTVAPPTGLPAPVPPPPLPTPSPTPCMVVPLQEAPAADEGDGLLVETPVVVEVTPSAVVVCSAPVAPPAATPSAVTAAVMLDLLSSVAPVVTPPIAGSGIHAEGIAVEGASKRAAPEVLEQAPAVKRAKIPLVTCIPKQYPCKPGSLISGSE